jgi:cytoskeletal protein RodZ
MSVPLHATEGNVLAIQLAVECSHFISQTTSVIYLFIYLFIYLWWEKNYFTIRVIKECETPPKLPKKTTLHGSRKKEKNKTGHTHFARFQEVIKVELISNVLSFSRPVSTIINSKN